MIGTGRKVISYMDILKEVSEFQILSYFVGINNIPCVINSPLRIDNNPSFGLYSPDGVKIYYKDLATGNKGGTLDLLCEKYGSDIYGILSMIDKNKEAIKKVNQNITTVLKSKGSTKPIKKTTKINVKVREFRKYDLEYWNSQGVDIHSLGRMYAISHIFIEKDGVEKVITAEKYAYVYVEFKDGQATLKIYQPFSKVMKWLSNINSSVWDMWEDLPSSGDIIVIASSRKDAANIKTNLKIPATSLQGEGYIPKPSVIEELKRRFKTIYILYDNDFNSEVNHGYLLGKKIASQYGLGQLIIPKEHKSKDPTDLYKNIGYERYIEVMEYVFNNPIYW